MFGSDKRKSKRLAEGGGIPALAKVVAAKHWGISQGAYAGTYSSVNQKLELLVQPEGAAPFSAELAVHSTRNEQGRFDPLDIIRLEANPDQWVPVLYDPNDPDEVALDRDPAALARAAAASRQALTGRPAAGGSPGTILTPSATAAPGAQALAIANALSKLADLHDRGVLTDDEFERQKQRLLAAGQ